MNANRFKLSLVALFTMLSTVLLAQTKKISGTILSDDAKPIAGVSVTIKGKKSGTQTNTQGIFTIEANEGSTLVFSMVGFTTREVVVGNSAIVDLTLSAVVSELEDVVEVVA
mgnify:CR=1 FL=1